MSEEREEDIQRYALDEKKAYALAMRTCVLYEGVTATYHENSITLKRGGKAYGVISIVSKP